MAFANGNAITDSGRAVQAGRMIGATPAQLEPKFIGIGNGATGAARTAAHGDTALSNEIESRATGTGSKVTGSVANDTVQWVGTTTATATRAVDEAMTFDASSGGNSFISSTISPAQPLNINDSLQLTMQCRYA